MHPVMPRTTRLPFFLYWARLRARPRTRSTARSRTAQVLMRITSAKDGSVVRA